MKLFFYLVFLFLASITYSIDVDIQEKLTIVSATRIVDLLTQVTRIKIEYNLKNIGTKSIDYFLHVISDEEKKHLAWISATESSKKLKNVVSFVNVKNAPAGFFFYKVDLNKPLGSEETVTLNVEYILTQILTPYPSKITQGSNQFVIYKGFSNILSAYKIEKESSSFKVGVKPISFTQNELSKFSIDKITYGPFINQNPFKKNEIKIHYENNSPFLVATNVERIIEVSHWGNIAVEEHINIVHKGAKLEGSFSRLDYQINPNAHKQSVVKSLRTILPRSSTNIYYRDQIGNISTSEVYLRANRIEVELQPRFPLFGGWKTNYIFGYNIPTDRFLFSKGSNYALKIRLINHLFDNFVIEKLTVKIILPEMSKNFKLVPPFKVKRLTDQVHKTYLDISGRPVIVFEKKNLIENHIQPITLYYDFDYIYLLREPLIVVCAVFLIFFVIIVFLRLDFTIEKKHLKKD